MYLESKVHQLSLTEEGENGKSFTVNYYLLEHVNDQNASIHCKQYGVKLEKTFDTEDCSECSYYPNIASSKSRATELIKLLFDNTVTPLTLCDVLSDLCF